MKKEAVICRHNKFWASQLQWNCCSTRELIAADPNSFLQVS